MLLFVSMWCDNCAWTQDSYLWCNSYSSKSFAFRGFSTIVFLNNVRTFAKFWSGERSPDLRKISSSVIFEGNLVSVLRLATSILFSALCKLYHSMSFSIVSYSKERITWSWRRAFRERWCCMVDLNLRDLTNFAIAIWLLSVFTFKLNKPSR